MSSILATAATPAITLLALMHPILEASLYRFCVHIRYCVSALGSRNPYLGEADISRLLPEALTADVESVFANETSLVCADAADVQLAISFLLRSPCHSSTMRFFVLYLVLWTYHDRAPLP